MIVEILFILIVICDIFTLLDIRSRNIDGSQKIIDIILKEKDSA